MSSSSADAAVRRLPPLLLSSRLRLPLLRGPHLCPQGNRRRRRAAQCLDAATEGFDSQADATASSRPPVELDARNGNCKQLEGSEMRLTDSVKAQFHRPTGFWGNVARIIMAYRPQTDSGATEIPGGDGRNLSGNRETACRGPRRGRILTAEARDEKYETCCCRLCPPASSSKNLMSVALSAKMSNPGGFWARPVFNGPRRQVTCQNIIMCADAAFISRCPARRMREIPIDSLKVWYSRQWARR